MKPLRLIGTAALAAVLLVGCSNPNDDWFPTDVNGQVWTASVGVSSLTPIPGVLVVPSLPPGISPQLYIDLHFSQPADSEEVSATANVELRAQFPIVGTVGGGVADLGSASGRLDPATGTLDLTSDDPSGGFGFDGQFKGFNLRGKANVNGVVLDVVFRPRVE